MKGSKGYRRGTRKLIVKPRARGKFSIRKELQTFEDNDKVAVTINPHYQAIPNPRLRGKCGRVVGRQGRAYFVELKDGNKLKKVLITPEHLTSV